MSRMENRQLIKTIDADAEFCNVCNRGVGMVIYEKGYKHYDNAPFMCWTCHERFPCHLWKYTEEIGVYFDLYEPMEKDNHKSE